MTIKNDSNKPGVRELSIDELNAISGGSFFGDLGKIIDTILHGTGHHPGQGGPGGPGSGTGPGTGGGTGGGGGKGHKWMPPI